MSDRRTDEELLDEARRAGEGDTRCFEALVRRYEREVAANCRYITRAPNDAEDLAQEVFVKIYFAMSRFEGRASFRTWLQRIKVNHCLNHLKKTSARPTVGLEEFEDPAAALVELQVSPAVERRMGRQADREQIGRILDSMSDTLRIPLVLRDFDRLTYEEIAETLGVGLSAAKMRIKRARNEFRRHYAGDRPAPEARGEGG